MASTNDDDILADGLASVKESAKFLGVSQQTIYNMIRDGEIAWTTVRSIRKIPWGALKRYVRGNLVGS